MFRKPFHIKTNGAMKGSDRRKLKSSVLQQFTEITADQVDALLPSKSQTTCMKIQTHAGDHLSVYFADGVPVFFENERVFYPTVYTLWKQPSLLPCLTTWPVVLDKMKGGADLMLPGVILSQDGLPHLEKSQLCTVNLAGNLAPVAIGTTARSSSDMFESGMKGKGILTLHCFGDHLWEAGDKSKPPQIDPAAPREPDQPSDTPNDGSAKSSENGGGDSVLRTIDSTDGGGEISGEDGGGTRDKNSQDGVEMEAGVEENVAAMAIGGGDEEAGGGEEEEIEEEDYGISPADAMDQLLYQCLLHSLKKKVKPSDLPLLTSTFYRNYIQSCCPEGKTLDMKKSSYKKLSKFLQAMQDRGLLQVKATSRGVDSVMAIHKDHTDIRSFVPPEGSEATETESAESSQQANTRRGPVGPPEIRQYYAVTQNQAPVLQHSGFQRGAWLTKEDVRHAVTSYVKAEGLVDQADFGRVTLDPILHDAVIKKTEGSVERLKWDQLFTRFLHKMSPGYQIIFPGDQATARPVIHKGQVQPIVMKVERKGGNKWITVIQNLAQFSLDPREFAHTLQIAVAASTTVGEGPNAKAGLQVTVQGNQIKFLDKYLTEHYHIPRRYIEGFQQAPKGKGKGKGKR